MTNEPRAAVDRGGSAVEALSARLPSRRSVSLGLPVLLAGLEGSLFARALWLFLAGTFVSGIAVGLVFRGGLSEIGRLAEPARRAQVMSAFFAAAYLGLGLPVILIGLISQLTGTVDASAWVAGLLVILAATVIVVRAFGQTAPASPQPTMTTRQVLRPGLRQKRPLSRQRLRQRRPRADRPARPRLHRRIVRPDIHRASVRPDLARAACSPLLAVRTARTTRAPARANSRAAIRPSPPDAPVTRAVRPVKAGRSAAVHLVMAGSPGSQSGSVDRPNFFGLGAALFTSLDGAGVNKDPLIH